MDSHSYRKGTYDDSIAVGRIPELFGTASFRVERVHIGFCDAFHKVFVIMGGRIAAKL